MTIPVGARVHVNDQVHWGVPNMSGPPLDPILDQHVAQVVITAIYESSRRFGIELAYVHSRGSTPGQTYYPCRNFTVQAKGPHPGSQSWTVWLTETNLLLRDDLLQGEVERHMQALATEGHS